MTTLPAGATAYTDSGGGLALNSTYTWKVAAAAGGRQGFAERTQTLIPAVAPGLSWADPAAAGTNLTVHGDGTVTDNQTNLMWQQTDDGTTRTWQSAIDYCASLSLAGYNDWRLPNRHELQSLIDYTTYPPAIDTTAFPAAGSSGYWSSSPYAGDASSAWSVDFGGGGVFSNNKTFDYYARCVRP